MDNEYTNNDAPNILISTSRNPSLRLLKFFKEFGSLVPNSSKINRGATKLKELVDLAERKNFTDIILLNEHRGEPNGMIISHMPYGPTAYFSIKNSVLRHDLKEKIDTFSLANPHLIFQNFNSKIGLRVKQILQNIFPVCKEDSKRIFTFYNDGDYILFRHHNYDRPDFNKIELNEIGPRFELKPFQIVQGNLIQSEANKEWVLRPYMNTAKKRDYLNDN